MKNLIILMSVLCLTSCLKGQDIECYSIGYVDSVVNHYQTVINNYDTIIIQVEDSLVGLYQDSL